MPEGDAVHRAARELQALVGEPLEVRAIHPRARATGVAERLDGRRLLDVEAHGKNLLFRFEGGYALRSHLRMSGRWRVLRADAPVPGRPWLVLQGTRQQAVLRGGGALELTTRAARELGPDILAESPDFDAMTAGLQKAEGREIGDALLDQRLVAGIGNIWRSEALWRAGVSPWDRLADLHEPELRAALEGAATLMRDSLDGRRPRRAVYRRTGRPCPRCGEPIRSGRQGEAARTVYWCPCCQPRRTRGKDPRNA